MSQSRTPSLLLAMVSCLFLLSPCLAQNPGAGANVNMVSGTDWTTGDPFLQRQNEPSVAVSTRNSLHLVGGANDYRTVDLAGLLGIEERGDAWLGLFKSFDGGQTWQSTLLPGYPLDTSSDGLASPLRGFQAGADPAVRAGTNGLFYYSGIAFNRGANAPSAVFLARFIDNDNRENGDATQKHGAVTNVVPSDSIRYLGETVIGQGSSSVFLDKPWLAVDVPRGSATCTINFTNPDGTAGTEVIPAGTVFVSYSAFATSTTSSGWHDGSDQDGDGDGDDDDTPGSISKILFTRSTDCGKTFISPIKITDNATNQASMIVVDPSSANLSAARLYVVWRRFADSSHRGGMAISKSIDGGKTFSSPVDVVTFPSSCFTTPTNPGCPIDQGLSAATPFGGSFRTNTYPTMAVDDTGRVYVAWTQRQANGDARIMMSVSADGVNWPSAGTPVDLGLVTDDLGNPFTNLSNPSRGHQIMPTLSFNAGKLTLAYYDLRQDHTLGLFAVSSDLKSYIESRAMLGELDSTNPAFNPPAVFNTFITDGPLTSTTTLTVRRHTIDLQGAQASPMSPGSLLVPSFSSFRISRYQFGINPFDSSAIAEQLQVNTPNLPLFVQGTQPFIGDYIDIAGAPAFVFNNGKWQFNTSASSNPVFHAVWTDNRDVRPPPDGDWTNYTPPFSLSNPAGPHASVFDPTQTVPTCTDDSRSGMRNQNIYTSRIAPGVVVGALGNSKTLGFISNTTTLLERMFALSVQNTTNLDKTFRITIANQPLLANGTVDPAGFASLEQFGPIVTTEDVTIPAQLAVSRPIFAQSANPTASIVVNVQEITSPNGTVISGGLQASTTLNPDPTAPAILDPAIANPAIANPAIANAEVYNPAIANPAIANPAIANPAIANPAIANPAIANPAIANPAIVAALNPAIANPAIANPAIANPAIANPAIANQTVTDASYTITNNGNTVGSYTVKLFGTQPAGTSLQLILSKLYATPASQNCQLVPQVQNIVLASVPDPVIETADQLNNPELDNSSAKNATINLRPGEIGVVTLRANVTTSAALQDIVNNVTPVVVSHAANTGTNTPPATLAIITANGNLTTGIVGVTYSSTLQSFGGNPPVTWAVISGSLPPGLTLDPLTGIISGMPTASGTFSFSVSLTDSTVPTPTVATRSLSITIATPLVIGTATLADGIIGAAYNQTLTATGGSGSFTWSLSSGSLPAGLTLSASGLISGTPITAGTSSFVLQVQDTGTPQQTKTEALTIRIAAQLKLTGGTLANAFPGVAYSQTIPVTGGTAPFTFALAPNSSPLPTGLMLSSAGLLSGTPSAAGTFSFTVQVTDSANPAQVATATFSLIVSAIYKVSFYVQPSNSSPGSQITPAIKVLVTDAKGKGVYGVKVTLTLAVNPGGGMLSGTTVSTTGNNGIAIFASDSIKKTGTGYVLQASTNLAGAGIALSVPFNIR